MISYQQFSTDWKGRAAYCATLSLGAIAVFLSAFLIAETFYTVAATGQLDEQTYGPSISVNGKGKVSADKEDIIATFSFGAQATSESVESAQEQATKVINESIAFLEEQGVDREDIETQSYNIYPHYEWIAEACPYGSSYCPGGRNLPVGFDVSQTIVVKVRDTSKAGDIFAGIGKKNVTNVSGLSFTIDGIEELKDKARALAIADAKARAKVNADALGLSLGDIIGMYESSPGYYPPMYEGMGGGYDMAVKTSPDVPTGEQEVEVSVDVQFEIEN